MKKAAEDLGYTQTRWHTFKRLDSIAAQHERAPHFTPNGMGYQLGVGVSARSQLGYTLYRNSPRLDHYLDRVENNKSPVEDVLALSLDDRKTQFVARSLGDGRPLVRQEYEDAFGCSIDENFGPAINRLATNGLISDTPKQLCLTEIGKLVHDLVTVSFYPQAAFEWLQQKEQLGQTQKV